MTKRIQRTTLFLVLFAMFAFIAAAFGENNHEGYAFASGAIAVVAMFAALMSYLNIDGNQY